MNEFDVKLSTDDIVFVSEEAKKEFIEWLEQDAKDLKEWYGDT